MAIKQRGKITKSSVDSTWFKNVAKSMGYATSDLVKDILPATHEFVSSNYENTTELISDMRQNVGDTKRLTTQIGNIEQVKIGKSAIKNALEDIRTGKIYNKDRENQFFEDSISSSMDDLGMDFGDDDFTFGDDFDGDEDVEDIVIDDSDPNVTNVKKVNVKNVNNTFEKSINMLPLAKAMNQQTEAIVGTMEASTNINTAMTGQMMMMYNRNSSSILNGLTAVNDNLSLLVNFQNDSMAKYIAASIKYYDDALKKTDENIEMLKQGFSGALNQNTKKSNEGNEFKDPFYSNGGLNIREYMNVVKSNINYIKESNDILSSMDMMFSDVDSLRSLASNPLKFVMKNFMGGFIPGSVKGVMETFDKSLSEFFPALLNKVATTKDSDNPFLKTINDVFGINNGIKKKADLGNYNRGVIGFDGESKKALVEVIPTYLSRIESAVTGNEERAFDYKSGVFRNISEMQKVLDEELRSIKLSGYTNVLSEIKKVTGAFNFKNEKELNNFNKEIENYFIKMTETGKMINPFLRNVRGETVDDLINHNLFMENPEMVDLFRRVFASLDKHTQYDAVGKSVLNSQRRMNEFFNDIENNPHLYGYSTLNNNSSKGSLFENKNGKYVYKPGNILSQVDKYGLGQLDYLRDIKSILINGIVTYPSGGGGSKRSRRINPNESFRRAMDSEEEKYISNTKSSKSIDSSHINESGLSVFDITSMSDEEFNNAVEIKRQALMDEDNVKKSSWLMKLFDKSTSGSSINASIQAMLSKPMDLMKSASKKLDNTIYSLIFGSDESEDSSFINRAMEGMKTKVSAFHSWVISKVYNPVKDFLIGENGVFTKFKESDIYKKLLSKGNELKEWLFGAQTENGRKGGLLSSVHNAITDTFRGVGHFFTGNEYVRTDGTVVAEKNDTVFRQMGEWFKGSFSKGREKLFGVDGSEGLFGKVYHSFLDGFDQFKTMLFGDTSSSGQRKTTTQFFESFKESLPKALGVGILGAGVGTIGATTGGLLGSLLFPGGPIGGAILGIGAGFLSQSDKFKNWFFGEKDPKTDIRIGGFLPKEMQDFFRDNKINLSLGAGIGAGVGLLPSFFLPGGPITGAILGMGTGLITKSDAFQEFIFGADFKNGKDWRNGFFGRALNKMKSKFDDWGIDPRFATFLGGSGAGLGLLSSFFTPLGPVGGALLGLAGGIAGSTEKFQQWMFGDKDDVGKRSGGFLTKFGNWTDVNVFQPLATQFKQINLNINKFFHESIAVPFKESLIPMKRVFKEFGENTKEMFQKGWDVINEKVVKVFHDNVAKPFGETMEKFVLNPLKAFMNGLLKSTGKIIGGIISAPFKAMNKIIGKKDDKIKSNILKDERQAEKDEVVSSFFGSFKKGKIPSKEEFKAFVSTFGKKYSDEEIDAIFRNRLAYYDEEKAYNEELSKWKSDKQDKFAEQQAEIDAARGKNKYFKYILDKSGAKVNKYKDERKAKQEQREAELLSKNKMDELISLSDENVEAIDNVAKINVAMLRQLEYISGKISVNSPLFNIGQSDKENKVKESVFTRPKAFKLPSHASGIDNVPFDGYVAELHKGEMVIPADQANKIRESNNISKVPASKVKGPVNGSNRLVNSIGNEDKNDMFTYVKRIAGYTRTIAAETKGQLDGVGKNTYYIRKLIQGAFGVDDSDLTGSNNKERQGFFGKLRHMMYKPLEVIGDKLKSAIHKPIEMVMTFVNNLKELPGKILEGAKNAVGKVFNFVTESTGKILDFVGDATFRVVDGLVTIGTEVGKGLVTIGTEFGKGLTEMTFKVGETLLDGAKTITTDLYQGFKFVSSKLLGGVVGGLDILGKAAVNLGDGLVEVTGIAKDAFVDITKGLYTVTKDITGFLWKGAKSLVTGAASLISNGVSAGAGIIGKILGKTLPNVFKKKIQKVEVVGGALDSVGEITKSVHVDNSSIMDVKVINLAELNGLKPKVNKNRAPETDATDLNLTSFKGGKYEEGTPKTNEYGLTADQERAQNKKKAEAAYEEVSRKDANFMQDKINTEKKEKAQETYQVQSLNALASIAKTGHEQAGFWKKLFGKNGKFTSFFDMFTSFFGSNGLFKTLLSGLGALGIGSIAGGLLSYLKDVDGDGSVGVSDFLKSYIGIGDDERLKADGTYVYDSDNMEYGLASLTKPIRKKNLQKTSQFILNQADNVKSVYNTGKNTVTKVGNNLADKLLGEKRTITGFLGTQHSERIATTKTQKAATFVVDTAQAVASKAGELGTKFLELLRTCLNKVSGFINEKIPKASNLTKAVTSIIEKFSKNMPAILSKFSGKISTMLTATAAGTASMGIIDGALLAWDVTTGLFEASHLFGVDSSAVDANMRIISSVLKGITKFSWIEVFNLANEITAEMFNLNFMRWIATEFYSLLPWTDGDMLKEAQQAKQQDWQEYNERNGTNLSYEAYLDETESTVFHKIWSSDFAKNFRGTFSSNQAAKATGKDKSNLTLLDKITYSGSHAIANISNLFRSDDNKTSAKEVMSGYNNSKWIKNFNSATSKAGTRSNLGLGDDAKVSLLDRGTNLLVSGFNSVANLFRSKDNKKTNAEALSKYANRRNSKIENQIAELEEQLNSGILSSSKQSKLEKKIAKLERRLGTRNTTSTKNNNSKSNKTANTSSNTFVPDTDYEGSEEVTALAEQLYTLGVIDANTYKKAISGGLSSSEISNLYDSQNAGYGAGNDTVATSNKSTNKKISAFSKIKNLFTKKSSKTAAKTNTSGTSRSQTTEDKISSTLEKEVDSSLNTITKSASKGIQAVAKQFNKGTTNITKSLSKDFNSVDKSISKGFKNVGKNLTKSFNNLTKEMTSINKSLVKSMDKDTKKESKNLEKSKKSIITSVKDFFGTIDDMIESAKKQVENATSSNSSSSSPITWLSNGISNLFGGNNSSSNNSTSSSSSSRSNSSSSDSSSANRTSGNIITNAWNNVKDFFNLGSGGDTSSATSSPSTVNNFTYYSQGDSKWGNKKLIGGSSVADAGCGPTSAAMVMSQLTGKRITPDVIAQANSQYLPGFSTEGLFSSVASQYGTDYNQVNDLNDVQKQILSGNPVILSGKGDGSINPYTNEGHLVVATGIDSTGKIMINDPRGRGLSKSYTPEALAKGFKTGFAFSNGKKATTIEKQNTSIDVATQDYIAPEDNTPSLGEAGNSGQVRMFEKVIQYARAFKGKLKYSMDGTVRNWINNNKLGADCSSFTNHVFKTVTGNPIGANTGEQLTKAGTEIPVSSAQPGDLIFFKGTYNSPHTRGVSHVGIVSDNDGNMIDQGSSGAAPKERSYNSSYWKSKQLAAVRVLSNPNQLVNAKVEGANKALGTVIATSTGIPDVSGSGASSSSDSTVNAVNTMGGFDILNNAFQNLAASVYNGKEVDLFSTSTSTTTGTNASATTTNMSGKTVDAEFTAYYPANNSLQGGLYDAQGNKLDPSKKTIAAPSSIPFGTKIQISGTDTSRDGEVYTVNDRGGAIKIKDDGTYRFDILTANKTEAYKWGRRKGKAIIGSDDNAGGAGTLNYGYEGTYPRTANNFVYYSQADPQWGSYTFADTNISRAGCGPTTMAMIMSQYTGKNYTPDRMVEIGSKYLSNGYTEWGLFPYIASQFKTDIKEGITNADKIKAELSKGNAVALSGRNGATGSPYTKGGHIVAAVGVDGNNILVNDPRSPQHTKAYTPSQINSGLRGGFSFAKTKDTANVDISLSSLGSNLSNAGTTSATDNTSASVNTMGGFDVLNNAFQNLAASVYNGKEVDLFATNTSTDETSTSSSGYTNAGSDLLGKLLENKYNLSKVFEVGQSAVMNNSGAGAISSGNGDAGGKSYGVVQFTSKAGQSVKGFINYLKQKKPEWGSRLAKHTIGSSAFDNEWKAIAAEDSATFEKLQKEKVDKDLYNPLVNIMKSRHGVDPNSRSLTLQAELFSSATQFGAGGTGTLLKNKFGSNANLNGYSDIDLSLKLLEEKYNSVGKYKFTGSSSSVQNSVRKRFGTTEPGYVKQMYEREQSLGKGGNAGYGDGEKLKPANNGKISRLMNKYRSGGNAGYGDSGNTPTKTVYKPTTVSKKSGISLPMLNENLRKVSSINNNQTTILSNNTDITACVELMNTIVAELQGINNNTANTVDAVSNIDLESSNSTIANVINSINTNNTSNNQNTNVQQSKQKYNGRVLPTGSDTGYDLAKKIAAFR